MPVLEIPQHFSIKWATFSIPYCQITKSPDVINHGRKADNIEHIHLGLRNTNSRGTGRLNFTTGDLKVLKQEFVTRNGPFHTQFYEQFDSPTSHAAFFYISKLW
jgi:hypothetical protein